MSKIRLNAGHAVEPIAYGRQFDSAGDGIRDNGRTTRLSYSLSERPIRGDLFCEWLKGHLESGGERPSHLILHVGGGTYTYPIDEFDLEDKGVVQPHKTLWNF